jgi:hypothetical protein
VLPQASPGSTATGVALRKVATCPAPIYGSFTEGLDTQDLKEAKGLIEALAARGKLRFDPNSLVGGEDPKLMPWTAHPPASRRHDRGRRYGLTPREVSHANGVVARSAFLCSAGKY